MSKNCKKKQGLPAGLLATILGVIFFAGGGYPAIAVPSHSENVAMASAQQPTLVANGTVVDSQNGAVVGATVIEKGTSNGAITDMDGKFSLNVQSGATLVISYLGFKSQEVKAGKDLQVVLTEDTQFLDELVVVGYGVQKKKLVTGATVQVKGDDIAKLNTTSVLGALQSQAPGVNITQVSGFIGDGFKVNIRGLGTNGNSSPIYVVDGVVGGDISGLSPNDIESIDVLKDAATAAIYGARAANGVILVTTKRGQEGKSEVSYDGYFGTQNLYKIPTILNAQEYMMIQDEMQVINGAPAWSWSTYIPANDLAAIQDGSWKGTNWLKEILNKNAPMQSHAINIASGTARSNSAMGVSYLKQEATMGVPNAIPELNRINARLNTEQIIFQKGNLNLLKVGETLNYRYQHMRGQVARDDIYWNSIRNSLIMSPLMYPYNAVGDYYTYADQLNDNYKWDNTNGGNKNPIAYMDYMMNQNISRSHYLQSSVYAELQPIKNLKLRSQFGYIMGASTYRAYIPAFEKLTETLGGGEDRVTQSASLSHQWTLDNTINYLFKVNNRHNFDALVGQSLAKSGYGESISASNNNSSFTDFEHAYLVNVPGKSTLQSLTGSPAWESGISSFFGRVSYNYDEKYLASIILRADGSSNFARGNRWGYFPSVSTGWVASNEEFWKNITAVDFLKLRLSYGQNGNCSVASNQHLSLITTSGNNGYSFGNSMGDASVAAYPMRLTNPDLKWETQEMFNIGIDIRFFRNRLGVELDAYQRNTYDWLISDPPVPIYWGAPPAAINGGDVRNTGFESAFKWNDRIGKDFQYNINLSTGFNKNEVTKIASADNIMHGSGGVLWATSDECFRAEVGKPFGFFYGYKTAGVFQNQQQIDEYEGPLWSRNTQPGDIIWVDANGDGVLDTDDRTMIGNPHPKFTLGFSFNVEYKGVSLDVTTYGAFGHQILKCYRDFAGSPNNNFTTDIFQRWHGEGTSNKYPRLASGANENWMNISDLYIENGDYLKIKNISLGYDFKRIFPKLPMKQFRIYVTAQNLFTFTGYSGMDPEIGYSAGASWTKGIDLGFYPSARTYMVGANVKF